MKSHAVSGAALEKKVTLTLSKEVIHDQIEKELLRRSSTRRLPGFRPGKAPASFLYKEEGKGLFQEVLRALIQKDLWDISQKESKEVYEYTLSVLPQAPDTLDDISDVALEIMIFFKPEMKEIDFSSCVIEDFSLISSDQDVEKELENRASKALDSKPFDTQRPAKKGDTLVYHLAYISSDEQEYTSEGAFVLGSGQFPKEFEDTLEGISSGHMIEERLRVPKNFPLKKIAGQKVTFKVLFSEVRETIPVDVNDRFAQAQGAKDLKELKEKVKQDLGNALSQLFCYAHQKKKIKEYLKQVLDFSLPETRVTDTMKYAWESVLQDTKEMTDEKKAEYLKEKGLSEKPVQEDLREGARDSLRLNIFLDHIIQKHHIKVSTEETKNILKSMADREQMTLDALTSFFKSHPDRFDAFQKECLKDKALHWIISRCKIEKKEISFEKFCQL